MTVATGVVCAYMYRCVMCVSAVSVCKTGGPRSLGLWMGDTGLEAHVTQGWCPGPSVRGSVTVASQPHDRIGWGGFFVLFFLFWFPPFTSLLLSGILSINGHMLSWVSYMHVFCNFVFAPVQRN